MPSSMDVKENRTRWRCRVRRPDALRRDRCGLEALISYVDSNCTAMTSARTWHRSEGGHDVVRRRHRLCSQDQLREAIRVGNR
jgi:hypothetical protein